MYLFELIASHPTRAGGSRRSREKRERALDGHGWTTDDKRTKNSGGEHVLGIFNTHTSAQPNTRTNTQTVTHTSTQHTQSLSHTHTPATAPASHRVCTNYKLVSCLLSARSSSEPRHALRTDGAESPISQACQLQLQRHSMLQCCPRTRWQCPRAATIG